MSDEPQKAKASFFGSIAWAVTLAWPTLYILVVLVAMYVRDSHHPAFAETDHRIGWFSIVTCAAMALLSCWDFFRYDYGEYLDATREVRVIFTALCITFGFGTVATWHDARPQDDRANEFALHALGTAFDAGGAILLAGLLTGMFDVWQKRGSRFRWPKWRRQRKKLLPPEVELHEHQGAGMGPCLDVDEPVTIGGEVFPAAGSMHDADRLKEWLERIDRRLEVAKHGMTYAWAGFALVTAGALSAGIASITTPYVGLAVVVGVLIVGMIGASAFYNRQQRKLEPLLDVRERYRIRLIRLGDGSAGNTESGAE